MAIVALLAALDHRRRTGEGQYIDVSQLEASTVILDAGLIDALNTGRVHRPLGNRDLQHAPHGVFPCAGDDRWCAIAVTSDEQWRSLARVISGEPLADDSRYGEAVQRLAAQDELEALISAWTSSRTVEQVERALQAVGVPAHRVATMQDAHEDAQLAHREHWWRSEHPVVGALSYESPAWRLSATPPPRPAHAPLLGQDSEYVYRELLGYSEDEFTELLVEGVVQ